MRKSTLVILLIGIVLTIVPALMLFQTEGATVQEKVANLKKEHRLFLSPEEKLELALENTGNLSTVYILPTNISVPDESEVIDITEMQDENVLGAATEQIRTF